MDVHFLRVLRIHFLSRQNNCHSSNIVWSRDYKVYILHFFFLIYVAPEDKMKTIRIKTLNGAIVHHGLIDDIESFKVVFFTFL